MTNSFPTGFDFNNPAESVLQLMDQMRSSFEKRAGSRMGRGDVRTGILGLLNEEPMHGYQIIREIEQRSGGHWKPSAGSVYPTLQLLAEEGLISAEESGGRKTYMLTEAGKEEAAEAANQAPWVATNTCNCDSTCNCNGACDSGSSCACKPFGKSREQWKDYAKEQGALPKAGIDLAQAVAQVKRTGTSEQVDQAVALLNETRRRIYTILAEG